MTNRSDIIEQLFKTHYERLHRVAVALLHDDNLARDIVHDVFASLLDSPSGTLDTVTPGYLLRAVRNGCLNQIRDCDIHQRFASRYFAENDEYDTEEWPDEETIACIYALIKSQLTEQERTIIRLRFTEGLTFAEVASEMGLSQTVIYRHLRHALIVIRQQINHNG